MCLPSKPDIPEMPEQKQIEAPDPLPIPAPPPAPPVMPPPPVPQAQTPAPTPPPLPPIPMQAPPPQLVTGDNLDDSGKVRTLKSKRAQLQQSRQASGTRIKKKKKKDQLAIEQGGLGGQAIQAGSAPTVNIQK